MSRLPVTLCVSTRNAAPDLPGCIESVAAWVSEIVVVDMESSDGTPDIARSHGAQVVEVPAAGWAEPGRQAGIDAASQPWILVLDADERAAEGLASVVGRYTAQREVAGVWLPRQNFQFGWWVPGSGIWPDWQLRLFRSDCTTWSGQRTHAGPSVKGRCEQAPGLIENAIVHHSFASISAWVGALDRYTTLEAERLDSAGRKATLRRLVAVPLARFADLYIRAKGYRGRRYGLTVALLSFCYWLMAELKLWERQLDASQMPVDSLPEKSRGPSE